MNNPPYDSTIINTVNILYKCFCTINYKKKKKKKIYYFRFLVYFEKKVEKVTFATVENCSKILQT
jgi:hypothetical protein